MPRNIDPASIGTGTGLAAKDSIEANALVHPTGGNDGLRAHIIDPSRAHQAAAIQLVDTAANFTSDEVEGGMAELATTGASGRQNGLLEGGTFTSLGLVITLVTTTTAFHNGNDKDYSGDSILLPNNQAVVWVYIDGTTGNLTSALTAPVTASDPILVARVDTLSTPGSVTNVEDARLFVNNVDRKLPFTVRAVGTLADAHSEGSFESLLAAFLWLEAYSAGGQIRKSEIIVRGSVTLSVTHVVPVDDLIIRGDDGAQLSTGAALAPMFDLNGKDRVKFRDLEFNCAHALSIAIADSIGAGAPADDLLVENCRFVGSLSWIRAINLEANTPGPSARSVFRHCFVEATEFGFRILRPQANRIIDCTVNDTSGVLGTVGIAMGHTSVAVDPTQGRSKIRGCVVTGFALGVRVKGTRCSMHDTIAQTCTNGIIVEGSNNIIADCHVTLDSTTGLIGIDIGGDNHKVRGCFSETTRVDTTYAASIPLGMVVRAASDRVCIENPYISGFHSTTSTGIGISAETTVTHLTINGGHIDQPNIGIQTDATGINTRILGLAITTVEQAVDLNCDDSTLADSFLSITATGAPTGLLISGENSRVVNCKVQGTLGVGMAVSGTGSLVEGCTIVLGTLVAVSGILAMATGVRVHDTKITNLRTAWTTETPYGVRFTSTGGIVDGCDITGFFNDSAGDGYGVSIEDDACKVLNTTVDSSYYGIVADGVDNTEIIANKIVASGVTDVGIHVTGDSGGAGRTRNTLISNNNIQSCVTVGILVDGYVQTATINGNTVDGFLSTAQLDPTSDGIKLERTAAQETRYITVADNVVQRCKSGILVVGVDRIDRIRDIVVTGNVIHHCAQADTATAEGFDFGGKGIGAYFAMDVIISDNHMQALGLQQNSVGVTGFPTVGGSNITDTTGIYLLNCHRTTVVGNSVKEPIAQNGGETRGIYAAWRNNAVSQTWETINITGNNLTGGTGSAFMDWGILVAADVGTVTPSTTNTYKGFAITDNVIEDVETGAIAVQIQDDQLVTSMNISGNNCAFLGGGSSDEAYIGVSVDDAGGVASFQDSLISDNVIKWGTGAGAGVTGIRVLVPLGSTSSFKNLGIKDNTVDSSNDSGGVAITDAQGIAVIAVGTPGTNPSHIDISGNQCRRLDTFAIHVGGDMGMSHLLVSGNTLENFEDLGLQLDFTGDTTSHVIQNNVFKAENVFAAGGKGMTVVWSTTLADTIEDIVIEGNTFTEIGGTGLEINHVVEPPAAMPNADNIRICRNLFGKVGWETDDQVLHVKLDGAGSNWEINDNTFRTCGFSGGTYPALHLEFVGSGDNYENISVDQNMLMSSEVASILVTFIDTTETATEAQIVSALSVSKNQVLDTTGIGVRVFFGNTASGGITGDARQIVLDGNIIHSPSGSGIVVEAGGMTGSLRSLDVRENQVFSSGSTGILINYPDRNTAGFTTAQVSHNTVTTTGLGHGISVSGFNQSGDFFVSNLMICGNIVTGATEHGIRFQYEPDTLSPLCKNILIADNIVRLCGTTSNKYGDYGISLRIPGAVEDLTLANNIASDNVGIGMYIDIGLTGVTEGGVVLAGYLAGTLTAFTVMGNNSRDNNTGAVVIDVAADGTNWSVSTSGIAAGNIHSAAPGAWVAGGATGDTWKDILQAAGGNFIGIAGANPDYQGWARVN